MATAERARVDHMQLLAPITFVTGKGGVGKSTVAGAIALGFARGGERVVLLELDDDEAGKRALAGADRKVSHVVVRYEEAVEAAIAPIVGGVLVTRTVLKHPAIRRLVNAVPALREFVSLERIRALVAERRYDRVVVDMPASGHAVDWLRVPASFERFLRGGPLGSLGRRIREEVVAEGRSDVVLVALPEPLVIRETAELAAKLTDEIGRGPAAVVVNRMPPSDPEGAHAAATKLASVFRASADPVAAATASLVALLAARAQTAADAHEALRLARGIEATRIVSIPEAPTDPSVVDVANWLRDRLVTA